MKKIYLLLLCFAFISLSGQTESIKLTRIKVNSADKHPIKGYLFDVDEDKITLVPKRKMVREFLLADSCKVCYTVPRFFIRDLKFSQKKAFKPIGSMVAGGLGLIFVAAADGRPNPDGLSDREFTGIYAAMGILLGGATDLLRLIGHFSEKNTADINIPLPNLLQSKSAVYQFNEQRHKQLDKLALILLEIKKDKTSHRKLLKIYTKDKKGVIGYILGQQDGMLLLGWDKTKIVSHRTNPSAGVRKIPFEHIFFYEFGL